MDKIIQFRTVIQTKSHGKIVSDVESGTMDEINRRLQMLVETAKTSRLVSLDTMVNGNKVFIPCGIVAESIISWEKEK